MEGLASYLRGFIEPIKGCGNGSGSAPDTPLLRGWILDLYDLYNSEGHEPHEFPRYSSKVIWDDMRSPGQVYMRAYGIFSSTDDATGVAVPAFGWAQFQSHSESAQAMVKGPETAL